jgi:diguanylate cyclase
VVARYGGEEFVIVMPQTDLDGACVFAERLRKTIANELPLTVSVGVAEALDGDIQDTLLARTDAALYQAKNAGRNCVFRHDGQQAESVLLAEPTAQTAGEEAEGIER